MGVAAAGVRLKSTTLAAKEKPHSVYCHSPSLALARFCSLYCVVANGADAGESDVSSFSKRQKRSAHEQECTSLCRQLMLCQLAFTMVAHLVGACSEAVEKEDTVA